MEEFREERDPMGPVRVPVRALWGAQTQRAVDNFPVSGLRMPRRFIAALARVKAACAEANLDLPEELRGRIRAAADEVAGGRHDDQFPVDVFQTGSGTSTNMNLNEVIARLAGPSVHPNDHVNRSHSSNDAVPTAVHEAALLALRDDLRPALDRLARALEAKAAAFDGIVKTGRTHLMDAMPVRLGQAFGGYATQVRKGAEQIDRAAAPLAELAIGGTAVGTGINAPPGFGPRVCGILARDLEIPFRPARNPFEAQGARDDLAMLSGALKGLACGLIKIANDLRWMGSGPAAGLAEIRIPDLQPGSSLMPGKVNPVMCEMLVQVSAQVIGNDAAITIGAQGGQFELNAMIPLLAHNLLQSIEILASGCRLFAERCVDGIEADEARCREFLERNPVAATVLNPVLGYDRTAELVKEAFRRRVSVKRLAVEQGLISSEEAERLFDFRRMTGP
jgi:fumarate hydratase class II